MLKINKQLLTLLPFGSDSQELNVGVTETLLLGVFRVEQPRRREGCFLFRHALDLHIRETAVQRPRMPIHDFPAHMRWYAAQETLFKYKMFHYY